MKTKRVTIEHPLWDRLKDLNKTAAKRFPVPMDTGFDRGFGALGMILHSRIENGGYWCTPTNTLAFAGTGGDGVHFSFLIQEGMVTEDSPIVVTVPPAFDDPNFIGGESLFDFLCLGYHRGYFALQQASSEMFFKAYSSAKYRPKADWEYHLGFGVHEHQQQLLDFLIAELGLKPWKNLKRKFDRLQKLFMPALKIPEGGEPL